LPWNPQGEAGPSRKKKKKTHKFAASSVPVSSGDSCSVIADAFVEETLVWLDREYKDTQREIADKQVRLQELDSLRKHLKDLPSSQKGGE
jgi:hypothetical protein